MALMFRLVLIGGVGGVAYGLTITAGQYPAFWVLIGFLAFRRMTRWRGGGWAYGSARMARLPEIMRGGLLSRDGVFLGMPISDRPSMLEAVGYLLSPAIGSGVACRQFLAACFGTRWVGSGTLRLNRFVHLLTVAAAGRGKGVSVVIPNLLSYRGSVVVTDPKAENFLLTADHRRKRLRHKIIRIDPFQMCGPGADSLNPMDFIDETAEDFLDQCRDLASTLVVRTGKEQEPHWNDSAELCICGFIAFVCACEDDRTKRHLGMVREMVSSPDTFRVAIETMQEIEGFHGVIKRLGGLLSWFTGDELSSVLTTVQRHTQFLDSPAVAKSVALSSFDPMELKRSRVSIYVCLPHDRLASLAGLNRMTIGSILRIITRGAADERNKVLFLLDEAAHLGRMPVLEEAITLMRGMGIRLWMIFQSLGQIREVYGEKADVVLDNFDTQQYFGINAYASADEISKRIGDHSVTVESRNDTSGRSWQSGGDAAGPKGVNHSTGRSITWSEIGRRLLKPEEIITLPDDVALLFHKNLPVIPTLLVRYFDSPLFKRGGTGAVRGNRVAACLLAVLVTLAGGLAALVAYAILHPLAGEDMPFPVPPPARQAALPANPAGGPFFQPMPPFGRFHPMGGNVRFP